MTDRCNSIAPVLAASLCLMGPALAGPVEVPPGNIPSGVHDPDGNFSAKDPVGIAHLVPLEARTRSRSEGNTATHLRRGIESGDDHPFMTAVCDVPGRLQSPASHRAQA